MLRSPNQQEPVGTATAYNDLLHSSLARLIQQKFLSQGVTDEVKKKLKSDRSRTEVPPSTSITESAYYREFEGSGIDGFAVDDAMASLRPLTPYPNEALKRTDPNPRPLVILLPDDPETQTRHDEVTDTENGRHASTQVINHPATRLAMISGAPQNNQRKIYARTPYIRLHDSVLGHLSNSSSKYVYHLFTYGPVTSGQERKSATEFIFTGSNRQQRPTWLRTECFIPLSDLHDRTASKVYDARVADMYALDWITFLLHTDVTYVAKCFTDEDKEMRQSIMFVRKLKPKEKEEFKKVFDGGHLLVSNRVGNCFEDTRNSKDPEDPNDTRDHNGANEPEDKKQQCKRSVDFLKRLLQPGIDEKIHNLSRYIFDRWVQLVYFAALEHKEPASIKARFLAIPKEVNPTLLYALDQQLKVKLQTTAEVFKQYLPSDLASLFSIELLEKEWKLAVESATKTVNDLHNRQNKIPIKVLGFNEGIPINLTELRPHPQRLFTVYVDLDSPDASMFSAINNRLLVERPFPDAKLLGSITVLDKLIRPMNIEDDNDTHKTTLTERSIQAARFQPRCKTQNAIMGEQSATGIAQVLFGGPQIRSAEWLHRFAYSFGNGGVPDDAQTQRNLVFGTYETNTDMIRYETYLKNLVSDVKKAPKSVQQIELETDLADNMVGDAKFPWLAKTLVYKWQFPHPLNNFRTVKMKHDFNLFSRKVPTRFEVDVDAAFDKLWMDTSSNEWRIFRYAVYWILFAQSL